LHPEIENAEILRLTPSALPGSVALPYRFGERDVAGFEIQLGFGGGAEDFGAVVVELAFPSRDDNRRQAVADQVYAGAAHVHQFVDAEDDGDAYRAEAGGEKAVQVKNKWNGRVKVGQEGRFFPTASGGYRNWLCREIDQRRAIPLK
jgi:hypothetical protein